MNAHHIIADRILERAVDQFTAADVPVAVSVDRLLTYAAAMSVASDGAVHTAGQLRAAATQVEAGVFAKFEPGKH